MVTGNRGVGKTSLVNKVIKETEKWWNNRSYLRINFEHNIKDEKDILRLIARTLNTKYSKFKFAFPYILITFILLSLFAYWFTNAVGVELFKNNQISININGIENILPSFCCQSFLSSFFLMYLFCVLLFRSSWFMAKLPTYWSIMRQLKKLNDDITYSTERENGINIMGYDKSIGIDRKTRKYRGVADSQEIEKELQDILNNMQRTFILLRPKIVIVFDELDKVEQGETLNTKASMFSVNTARERQTEILKILSNMESRFRASSSVKKQRTASCRNFGK